MTSIDFYVIGLTRPGFESVGSILSIYQKWDTDAQLIRPSIEICIYVNYIQIYVADCTDLSGKEPHRHTSMDRVTASGSLGGIACCLLNGRNCGFEYCSRHNTSHLHRFYEAHLHDVWILYKLCTVWVNGC